MWKLNSTWGNPGQGAGPQQGFPAPGSGAQTTGPHTPAPAFVPRDPVRPTKGARSWFKPAQGAGPQQGFPAPENAAQRRPPGSMPNKPIAYGLNMQVWTPYYDRGADAYVQNYGKVLTNPIGAGIVANNRPQASYGSSGVYENGAIWWVSQVIPTSINLTGLTDPEALLEILGMENVQAVVRTTG